MRYLFGTVYNRLNLLSAIAVLAVIITSCGSTATVKSSQSFNYGPPIGIATGPVTKTVGPNGEPATPASAIIITKSELSALKQKHYTAAMLWHQQSTFVTAVTEGAEHVFAEAGIKVVAITSANFSAATQASQVSTVMALHPNIILTLPVDPVSAATYFMPAVNAGVKIVLLSNVPQGWQAGKQYVGTVTDNLAEAGKDAAELMCKAVHGKGQIGFIYYEANYYVTNERDAAFRTYMHLLCPGAKIVAQEGVSNPADSQAIAAAMITKYPNLNGIYATFTSPVGDDVVAALRAAGKPNVKVVTLDLDPTAALDMARGKYVYGIVSDTPYIIGETMAKEAALAMLGKQVPPFSVVPELKVTRSNLVEAWREALPQNPPSQVLSALGG